MAATSNYAGNTIDLAESMASATTRRNEDPNKNKMIAAASDGSDENNDDLASSLHCLPPELRHAIYRFVFDLALPRDIWKDVEPETCYPVPPIARAWPELHGECIDEWRKYLSAESFRLRNYLEDVEASRRRTAKGCATSDYGVVLFGYFLEQNRAELKQKQVEVLQNNCNAEPSCSVTRREPRLTVGSSSRFRLRANWV